MSDNLIDFTAGSIGGFAGKLLDYPFDTVKVLLQTQNVTSDTTTTIKNGTTTATTTAVKTATATARPSITVYNGAIHCLRHTIETKGFWSLYNGISSPLLGSMAENAVLFLAYNEIKRQMGEIPGTKELSLLELSLAGAGAGTFVPFVLTPVELIKCRLQVQNSAASGFVTYKGPIDCLIHTIKEEGFAKGLYRGNVSTLLREVPGNFCWYGVYEGVCKVMIPDGGTKADLGPSAHLLGGAMAGVAYWTAFYPADTVKSHIQTNPKHADQSFIQTFNYVYRREGMRGLYRGWGITAARAAPAHAAIFAVYEYTLKLLRPGSSSSGQALLATRD